jgi:hypothetical protein
MTAALESIADKLGVIAMEPIDEPLPWASSTRVP